MIFNLNYFFFLFFFIISIILSCILVIISFFFFIKKKTKNIRRKSLYECGFESFGDSHILINIQFINVALLFVIFDLELLFILPWIISVNFLGFLGFFTIFIVLTFFIYGFFYEWYLGALMWKKLKNPSFKQIKFNI